MELAGELTGHIEETRRAAYVVAHGHWRATVPEAYQIRPGSPATVQGAHEASRAVLFGVPTETKMRRLVMAHVHSLGVALHEAARPGLAEPARLAHLDRWAERARKSIGAVVHRAIVAGVAHADMHAIYGVMDPAYIDRYVAASRPNP